MVTVDDQDITVIAVPAEASALDFVMPMLKAGKIAEAVSTGEPDQDSAG